MYSDVRELVRSKEDVDVLLGEIDMLSASIYKSGKDSFEQTLKTKVRQGTAGLWEKYKDQLPKVREWLQGLRVLKLTVAWKPNGETVEEWDKWVRQNVGEDVILEIRVDASVVAGAIVEFGGKYEDLSAKLGWEKWEKEGYEGLHSLLK